jgi:hypothetical protein
MIQGHYPQVSVAFLLPTEHTYELHMFESEAPIGLSAQHIRSWFTEELVASICRLNKSCKLDDMYPMGLQAGPSVLNKVSLSTIPLLHEGCSLGFILICSQRQDELNESNLARLLVTASGLSKAIRAKLLQAIATK